MVMGNEVGGDANLALDALQLNLHVDAQCLVERAERLIKQQNARLGNDGAADSTGRRNTKRLEIAMTVPLALQIDAFVRS